MDGDSPVDPDEMMRAAPLRCWRRSCSPSSSHPPTPRWAPSDRRRWPRTDGNAVGVRGLERASQLAPGPDPELGEHVAQVPLDGAFAEEEAGADLRVREPIAGELGDLTLLRREIVAGLGDPPAGPLPRGGGLGAGAVGGRPPPPGHGQP